MRKTLLTLLLFTSTYANLSETTKQPQVTITFTQLKDRTYKTQLEISGQPRKRNLSNLTIDQTKDEAILQVLNSLPYTHFTHPLTMPKFNDWETEDNFIYSFKLNTIYGLTKLKFIMPKTCTLTCKYVHPYEEERITALKEVLHTTSELQALCDKVLALVKNETDQKEGQKETILALSAILDNYHINEGENILSSFENQQTKHSNIFLAIALNLLEISISQSSISQSVQPMIMQSAISKIISTSNTEKSVFYKQLMNQIHTNQAHINQPYTIWQSSNIMMQKQAKRINKAIQLRADKQRKPLSRVYIQNRSVLMAILMIIIGSLGLLASLTVTMVPAFNIYGICALFAIMISSNAYSILEKNLEKDAAITKNSHVITK